VASASAVTAATLTFCIKLLFVLDALLTFIVFIKSPWL
jgi:hypothetical protein